MLIIDNNTSMEAHAVHRDWITRDPVDGRTFSDSIAECTEAKRPSILSDGMPISNSSQFTYYNPYLSIQLVSLE